MDIAVGEEVWVKPPNSRCTTRWGKGTVTEVLSKNKVAIDGMPRHILDIRRVSLPSEEGEVDAEVEVSEEEPLRRSHRERRRPAWMADYDTNY